MVSCGADKGKEQLEKYKGRDFDCWFQWNSNDAGSALNKQVYSGEINRYLLNNRWRLGSSAIGPETLLSFSLMPCSLLLGFVLGMTVLCGCLHGLSKMVGEEFDGFLPRAEPDAPEDIARREAATDQQALLAAAAARRAAEQPKE